MTLESMITGDVLAVWRLLGALLGTLLLVAGSLWAGAQVTAQARALWRAVRGVHPQLVAAGAGAQVTAQARALWRAVRGVHPQLVAAVDDPADPLPVQLERLSTVPATVWATFLPAFLNALAVGLDRALGDAPDAPAE